MQVNELHLRCRAA